MRVLRKIKTFQNKADVKVRYYHLCDPDDAPLCHYPLKAGTWEVAEDDVASRDVCLSCQKAKRKINHSITNPI